MSAPNEEFQRDTGDDNLSPTSSKDVTKRPFLSPLLFRRYRTPQKRKKDLSDRISNHHNDKEKQRNDNKHS